MLLSDADLRKELEAGRLVLDPWDPAMLQPSSVDVRLDRFFRVFQNSRYTHIDPRQQQDELTTRSSPRATTRSSCIRASSCWDRRTRPSPCRTILQVG